MAYNDIDSVPIGALFYFASSGGAAYLNQNWLKCDGTTYSQATYSTLYSHLGLLDPGGTVWTSQTSGTSSNLLASTYGTIYVADGS